MKTRRWITAVAWTLLAPAVAWAQAGAGFPDRPLKIVVPFGPGGLADVTFRLVSEKLAPLLGKPVLVENVPGAGGVAAANSVLRAKADGHTLMVLTNGTAITKSLFRKLAYDPVADFAPVSLVAYFDLVLLVRGDGPYKALGDVLAAAKASPGKLNIGTINPGSTQNLTAELFKSTAAIEVSIVPFRTSPDAATALISGNLDMIIESYTAMKGLIDGGKLRPLASTGSRRSVYLPSLPTVKEAGVPSFDVTGWNALVVPKGTPAEAISVLNRHVNAVVALPEVRARLQQLGTEAHAGPPEELWTQFTNDIAKWGAVIRQANIPLR